MEVHEIIDKYLKRIRADLAEIPGIAKIDFIDIFPKSPEHRRLLDEQMLTIAEVVQETERGNIYKLNSPIATPYGALEFVKIRFYDESRLNWEAEADFVAKDRQVLMDKVGIDQRFSYLKRPDWDAVEFKTDDALIYFVEPPASDVYTK